VVADARIHHKRRGKRPHEYSPKACSVLISADLVQSRKQARIVSPARYGVARVLECESLGRGDEDTSYAARHLPATVGG
jgi:hypothetical protein